MKFNSSIRHMDSIHKMAVEESSIIDAMATQMPMPSWNDILFVANQLNLFHLMNMLMYIILGLSFKML